jgi:hypothetical protein
MGYRKDAKDAKKGLLFLENLVLFAVLASFAVK